MSNRIDQLFDRKEGNILSIYITAGFPDIDDTVTLIRNLEISGVDMIEIGIPFSDPLADGPIIQQSSETAIDQGMTLNLLFSQLKDIRASTQIPLVLMGYLNPVLQYGEQNFIVKCAEIGIDGIIIPDMPVDYYCENLKEICREHGIANILLITPETSPERIWEIDAHASGFIYMVSSNSITGSKDAGALQPEYFQRVRQMQLKNRTLIGFGIHNSATLAQACNYSSGAIVGSAFINHVSTYGVSQAVVTDFVLMLRGQQHV